MAEISQVVGRLESLGLSEVAQLTRSAIEVAFPGGLPSSDEEKGGFTDWTEEHEERLSALAEEFTEFNGRLTNVLANWYRQSHREPGAVTSSAASAAARGAALWGLARRDGNADAAYFVHWTLGNVTDVGAHFDLILGRWGEDATPADRYAVSLEYRRTDRGPAFMVIDATTRPIAHNELVARALRRDQVVGTALASHVFELVDAIWLKDRRIREVVGDDA